MNLLKTRIVGGGIIKGEMESAAFVASQRTVDDQASDRAQAAQFKKFGRNPKVPIKILYLALKVTQPGAGSQHILFRANDSNVIPHEPPDLIPIVINDHDFIDILGVTCAPFREIKCLIDI